MSMREMWNKSWNVNTTSTYILTHTLMPILLKSSDPRLIFITSGTSTLSESTNLALAVNKSPAQGWPKKSLGIPAYRSSKTGMNMMMREWARTLKEDGVKLWCISPGFLATGLGGNPGKSLHSAPMYPLFHLGKALLTFFGDRREQADGCTRSFHRCKLYQKRRRGGERRRCWKGVSNRRHPGLVDSSVERYYSSFWSLMGTTIDSSFFSALGANDL